MGGELRLPRRRPSPGRIVWGETLEQVAGTTALSTRAVIDAPLT
jgi:hypothetical protein